MLVLPGGGRQAIMQRSGAGKPKSFEPRKWMEADGFKNKMHTWQLDVRRSTGARYAGWPGTGQSNKRTEPVSSLWGSDSVVAKSPGVWLVRVRGQWAKTMKTLLKIFDFWFDLHGRLREIKGA